MPVILSDQTEANVPKVGDMVGNILSEIRNRLTIFASSSRTAHPTRRRSISPRDGACGTAKCRSSAVRPGRTWSASCDQVLDLEDLSQPDRCEARREACRAPSLGSVPAAFGNPYAAGDQSH